MMGLMMLNSEYHLSWANFFPYKGDPRGQGYLYNGLSYNGRLPMTDTTFGFERLSIISL